MWCESGSDRVEQRQGGASLAALAGHALAARVCLLRRQRNDLPSLHVAQKGSVEFSGWQKRR